MIKRNVLIISLVLTFSTAVVCQNSNTSTSPRPRSTTTTKPATETQKATDTNKPKTTPPAASTTQNKPKIAANPQTDSAAVLATFATLLDGIRHANVAAVTGVYWNSPRLILFNNNGTFTKGWEQMHKNREASYPDLKDVKLDVHDVSVVMLGRDGAVLTCLWNQSQTYKGTPESASGRMTMVFRRVGKDWKAVHLHTSPDKPDASRVLPSEQATPNASPTPKP